MLKQRKTLRYLITMGLLYFILGTSTINVKAVEPEAKLHTEISQDTTEQDTEITSEDTKQSSDVIENEIKIDENLNQVPTPAVSTIYELSPEIIAYCKAASNEFSYNEYILEALIFTESRGKSDAKNGSYVGLTQFKPSYFESVMEQLNITDPMNPRDNVRICAYQLAQWSEKYDNNTYLILDCWHKGEGKAVAQFNAKGNSYNKTICNNANLLYAEANKNKSETEIDTEKPYPTTELNS